MSARRIWREAILEANRLHGVGDDELLDALAGALEALEPLLITTCAGPREAAELLRKHGFIPTVKAPRPGNWQSRSEWEG